MQNVLAYKDIEFVDEMRRQVYDRKLKLMHTDFLSRKHWRPEVIKWLLRHPDNYLILASTLELTASQLESALKLLDDIEKELKEV